MQKFFCFRGANFVYLKAYIFLLRAYNVSIKKQQAESRCCAMNSKQVRKLVLTALCTALTAVATMVIQIPSPMSGYVNLGDCMVLLSAWLLGPFAGAAAAGVGSALADILTGYTYYAPGTLIIKAAMALTAGLIARAWHRSPSRRTRPALSRVLGAFVAEIIMVLGYFAYAALLLGNGLGAAASIPGNLVQGAFGLVAALLLAQMLARARALPRD